MRARFLRVAAALGAAVLMLGACTSSEPSGTPASPGTPGTPGTSTGSPRPVPNRTVPRWMQLADAGAARQEVAVAVLEGEAYVVGGFEQGGRTSNRVDVYDLEAGTWRAGPPLPQPRHHAMAATFRGSIYVMGGFDASGRPSDSVFQLESNNWSITRGLRRPRAAGAAIVEGDRLMVFGGQGTSELVREPEALEPQSRVWLDLAPMPTTRHHLAVAGLDGKVYATGGRAPREGSTVNVRALERYDIAANSWEALPDLPVGRSGHGAAIVNGALVLAGGETPGGGQQSIARVDVFDIEAAAWSMLAEMPRPRHGVGVVVRNEKVYVFLGGARAGLDPTRQSDVLVLG